MSFEELSRFIGDALPSARAAGVGFDEVAAAIARMTVAGIRAPQATTALKGAINALAAPTPEAAKQMEALGISWRGLTGTLEDIAALDLNIADLRALVPDVDSERRGDLLRTAMAVEVTRMLSQHRLNRVRLQMPVGDQVFDLVHTVHVRALGIQAQGKTARVVATWDHDAGSELVDLELAISRAGATVEPTPLVPPARPVFDFGPPPPGSAALTTQLGGRPESPPFDEEQDGFAGNYRWLFPGAETYPRRLQITTPDIPAGHRDPTTGERSASYTVDIPHDLLMMEVL